MKREDEVERGFKADQLLSNELYQECVTTVRNSILSAWSQSPVRDKEGQHELRLMLKLLDDLQANIKTVADTGKLAAIQIEREKGFLRRAVGF